VFDEISKGKDKISFQQYIEYMVSITKDQVTQQQLLESFKALCNDKVRTLPEPSKRIS
jgi:Ca2+-binding EF-hand superfamily protein